MPRGHERRPCPPLFFSYTPSFTRYVPGYSPGTMKPGTTPENSPLKELLKLEPPHEAPHFQEVRR